MNRHVTTRDIARALGLHHSTVSLALRDSPLLKANTKQRIQEEAKKLGYKPDPMLNALSAYRLSKRSGSFHAVIAWINNWHDRDGLLANPTFRSYYEGVCACANSLGYNVQEFWMYEPGMTSKKLQTILRARNIQGILLPPQSTAGHQLDIDFADFYAVAFGYSTQPSNLHLVTNHHAQTMDLLMSKLVESGYLRPGYCISPLQDARTNYIFPSRVSYLTARYPNLIEIPRAPDDDDKFARWMQKYKPDVLIGFNEFLLKVEALGYKVPDDIGFASPAINPSDTHISGTNENDFKIGQTAVNVLVGMINHQERGVPEIPVRTLVDSTWFPGETLRMQTPSSSPVSDQKTGLRKKPHSASSA